MARPVPIRIVEQFDRALAEGAACVREVPPVKLLSAASDIADQPQLSTLCLSVFAFGVTSRDPRLTRAGARMFVSWALATWAKGRIKRSIDRTRPAYAEIVGYAAGPARHSEGHWNSFPSGHTAGAIAVAEAFGREYPAQRGAAMTAAATVAAVQVPRGKHYLTDLAAGALVGWVSEGVVDRLAQRWLSRRPV